MDLKPLSTKYEPECTNILFNEVTIILRPEWKPHLQNLYSSGYVMDYVKNPDIAFWYELSLKTGREIAGILQHALCNPKIYAIPNKLEINIERLIEYCENNPKNVNINIFAF
jgi:hypothetical protein